MRNLDNIKFKVVSCNETENGDYHVKLQYKGNVEVEDDFGKTTKKMQITYYRFLDNEVAIDTKGKIDFNKFDIQVREYDTGEEIVDLKYLVPKST